MFAFPSIPLRLAHCCEEGCQAFRGESRAAISIYDVLWQQKLRGSPKAKFQPWLLSTGVESITLGNIPISLLFPSLQRQNNSQPFIYEKLFTALEHRYVHKSMCVFYLNICSVLMSHNQDLEKTVLRTWIGEELSSKMSPLEEICIYHHIVKADCKILVLKELKQDSA